MSRVRFNLEFFSRPWNLPFKIIREAPGETGWAFGLLPNHIVNLLAPQTLRAVSASRGFRGASGAAKELHPGNVRKSGRRPTPASCLRLSATPPARIQTHPRTYNSICFTCMYCRWRANFLRPPDFYIGNILRGHFKETKFGRAHASLHVELLHYVP